MVTLAKNWATEYARGYFEQNEDVARFGLKSCKPSIDYDGAKHVELWVEWKDGSFDAIEMTVWFEDGQPYGEW